MVLDIMKSEYLFRVLEYHKAEYLVFLFLFSTFCFIQNFCELSTYTFFLCSIVLSVKGNCRFLGFCVRFCTSYQNVDLGEQERSNRIGVRPDKFSSLFYLTSYHIAFLITQIPPGQQCHADNSLRNSSLRNSSTIQNSIL